MVHDHETHSTTGGADLHQLDLLDLVAGLPVTTVVALHTGRVHSRGASGDVLTEELIAEVYGVRAAVSREGAEGRPRVRFLGTLL